MGNNCVQGHLDDVSLIESLLFKEKPVNVAISGLAGAGKSLLMKQMIHKGSERHAAKTNCQLIFIDTSFSYVAPQVMGSSFPTFDCNQTTNEAPFGLNPFSFVHDGLDLEDQAQDIIMAVKGLLAPSITLSERVVAPSRLIASELIQDQGSQATLQEFSDRLIKDSDPNVRYLGSALKDAIGERFLNAMPNLALDGIVQRIQTLWGGEDLVHGVYSTILGIMAIKKHMANTPQVRKIVAIDDLCATPCGDEMREAFDVGYECLFDVIKRLWASFGQFNASGIAVGTPMHPNSNNLYDAVNQHLNYHVVMFCGSVRYELIPFMHYSADDIKAKFHGSIEHCYSQVVLQKVKGQFGAQSDIMAEHVIPLRLTLLEVVKANCEPFIRNGIHQGMVKGLTYEQACVEVSKTMIGPTHFIEAS
jgi:hypothetical protein